ncbi:MAG: hypothetical protein PWQ88_5 [Candidatus Methanomethylophilaceae archaeon]|nr:hypothetical protein [Candidatus Methanomethylophilaceae archaeon]MDI3541855.1 hypothetical protein [Candidatus Methanomethylophilaceae archaeon]
MERTDLKVRTATFALLSISCLIASYLFLIIDDMDSLFQLLLPFSYFALGMLIKYGDQAYDVGCFDRRKALVLAFPSGLWFGYMMINDPPTAAIGIGMLLGLLFAKKYDNRGFIIGFLIAIGMVILGLLSGKLSFSIYAMVLVIVATYVDELVNDIEGVDRLETLRDRIFQQRPFLKIAIFFLCVVGTFPSFAYLFMMLSFDFGYALVDCVSQISVGSRVG